MAARAIRYMLNPLFSTFVCFDNPCYLVQMVSSENLNHPSLVFLGKDSLATLAFRLSALLMVLILCVFLSICSNPFFVHSRRVYLRTAIVYVFNALRILPPFCFDASNSLIFLMYPFLIFSFISFIIISFAFYTSRYL